MALLSDWTAVLVYKEKENLPLIRDSVVAVWIHPTVLTHSSRSNYIYNEYDDKKKLDKRGSRLITTWDRLMKKLKLNLKLKRRKLRYIVSHPGTY
jgi:hypothetical protein